MKRGLQLVALMMAIGLFITAQPVSAAIVDVTVTGSWLASDFTVAGMPTMDPSSDGKVFGVAPSDGSTTFTLRVDTDSSVSFSAGYTFTISSTTYTLAHDWFGYSDVTLVDSPYTFGTATWETSGILSGLVGPDDLTAALWTDEDITIGDPTRLSFRMFGTGDGLSADLFVGSRTYELIGPQFLLWEYLGEEEIRSNSYSASVSPVPEPSTLLLLGSGLVGLVGFGRKKFRK